jgi:SAM-dependent methyltransferase
MTDHHTDAVARHFAEAWRSFDEQIRQAVPRYDDAVSLLVDIAARTCATAAPRVLDIGVGTGNLAALLLDAFPGAHLTGVDIVPEFLGVAQRRLSRFGDRVRLVEADVAWFDFGERRPRHQFVRPPSHRRLCEARCVRAGVLMPQRGRLLRQHRLR